jgi:microsomal prostaglandin-E synthase 1
MPALATDPNFKIYLVCSVVLSMLMIIVGAMTAAKRNKVGKVVNPEDLKVSSQGTAVAEGEHPDVARIQRVHRNLLEGVPIFYAIGLISVIAGASPLVIKICLCTYTGARVLHAIVYLNGLQPWRTIFFGIGLLSLLGMMVMSLVAAFA